MRLSSLFLSLSLLWVGACGPTGPNLPFDPPVEDSPFPQSAFSVEGGEVSELPDGDPVGPPEVKWPELAVTSFKPSGEAHNTTVITVHFNQPMVAMEKLKSQQEVEILRTEPPLEGRHRWITPETLQFEMSHPPQKATRYRITIPAGTPSAVGKALAEDHVAHFVTERPLVSSFSPLKSVAGKLTPSSLFSVTFNHPIGAEALARSTSVKVKGAPVPFKLKTGDKGTTWLIEPESALEKDAPVRVEIAQVVGLFGDQPMLRPFGWSGNTYGPLKLANVCTTRCSWHAIYLPFNNPLGADAVKHVRAAPARGKAILSGQQITIPGPWEPGSKVTVEVGAGIVDVFGQRLSNPGERVVGMAPLDPSISIPQRIGTLERYAHREIHVTYTSLPSVDWRFATLSRDQIVPLLNRGISEPFRGGLGASTTLKGWSTGGRVNRQSHRPVPIDRALGGPKGAGVLVGDASWAGMRDRSWVMFQVTDLGLSAHYDDQKIVLWVTSLSKGAPIGGVGVELRDQAGAVRWTGKTDAQGLAEAPGVMKLGLTPQTLYALAWKGEDTAYVHLDGGGMVANWHSRYRRGSDPPRKWVEGQIISDRHLYKAGETAHLRGVLRADDHKTVLPFDTRAHPEVMVDITTPRGKALGDPRPVAISRFGTFNLDVVLPEKAELGNYQVSARIQGEGPFKGQMVRGTFEARAFKTPEFEVSVTPGKPRFLAGDEISADLGGRYLFGAPMRGAEVHWRLDSHPAWSAPPSTGDEAIDQRLRHFSWADTRTARQQHHHGSGSAKLDDRGRLIVKSNPHLDQSARQYTLRVTVTDVNRQAISSVGTFRQEPAEVLVGIRSPERVARAGDEARFEALVVDLQGKARADAPLAFTIERQEWHVPRMPARHRHGYGEYYEPRHVKVAECKALSKAQPQSCRFTPDRAGTYIARVVGADKKGRSVAASTQLVVYGGQAAWAGRKSLEMWPDRGSYRVGDTARIMVQSPWPSAHGLLTVEKGGIMTHEAIALRSHAELIEVKIPQGAEPNVHLTLTLVRGRTSDKLDEHQQDVGRPMVVNKRTVLAVDNERRRLRVEVVPDKAEARPGDTLGVKVRVTDHEGDPVEAEVSVAAVDQGIFNLIAYRLPDLFAHFWHQRPANAAVRELRQQVIPRRPEPRLQFQARPGDDRDRAGAGAPSKRPSADPSLAEEDMSKDMKAGEKKEDRGPGESRQQQTPDPRDDFRASAHWSPALKTDQGGLATLSYALPDNLTTWRLVAVAVDPVDRFGTGDARMKVNKPLLLRPSLPRFANPGDLFDATVVVQNETAVDQDLTLRLDLPGGGAVGGLRFAAKGARASQSRALTVKAGAAQEVAFSVVAGSPGPATFTFTALADQVDDAVEVTIPVIRPVSSETVAAYGDTLDARAYPLVPPDDIHEDVGGLTVGISSTAMVGLSEGLGYLVRYPHGCLEQTVSKALPLVAMSDLVEAFGIEVGTREGAGIPEMVQFAVDKVQRMQRGSGGFSYWSSASAIHAYASVYAMHFLAEARRHGFRVDDQVFSRGLVYLRGLQNLPSELLSSTTAAHAAWILAEAGELSAPQLQARFDERDTLPIFAQAFVALAAHHAGDGDKVRALVQELVNASVETAGEAHFSDTRHAGLWSVWHSETRTDAIVLMALMKIVPDHPLAPKVVRWLMKKRERGHWRNTQENVYALMALDRYFRAREAAAPDFIAQAWLGEVELLKAEFKGRSMEVKSYEIAMPRLLSAKRDKTLLTVAKKGPGRLYYTLRLSYAPASRELDPRFEGFGIERTYTLLEGEEEPIGDTTHSLKFPSGQTLRVRLKVHAPGPRRYVVIDDPLPAGLEPVDFRFATTDASKALGSHGFRADHHEMRDERVVFYIDRMSAGTHTFDYVARTTTRGNFYLPPARVEDMYAPETFARTASATFHVD